MGGIMTWAAFALFFAGIALIFIGMSIKRPRVKRKLVVAGAVCEGVMVLLFNVAFLFDTGVLEWPWLNSLLR